MKAQSAPSLFDRVGYIIFKRCPSLLPALFQLFNVCWDQATIPVEWKCAAIKLIQYSSSDNATNPLTPYIGKLLTTLLRNRWLRYMVVNNYLDSCLGFPADSAWLYITPSQAVINSSRGPFKPQISCSLGAYITLIGFSLCGPPQFLATVQALYTGLNTYWAHTMQCVGHAQLFYVDG